jgi:GGDEF domain-containing protein
MTLRPLTAWGQTPLPDKVDAASPHAERFLTLLAEGAALNVPEIDAETYQTFRANISRLALQLPDRLSEDEKLIQVRAVLHEFESYRNASEGTLREQLSGWRALTDTLFRELLLRLGIDTGSTDATPLVAQIAELATAKDLEDYLGLLHKFLHPVNADGSVRDIAAPLRVADRSTANDNAAGLRGVGSAVEHLRHIMERGGDGYIALFRLGCLEMISQRFGLEAVQDCLMAVSAFLTHSLHGDDAIYHWNDSTLLAILQGRISEQILTAELQRIAAQNRDITVNVDGRIIMLRIPLDFDLTPIVCLRSADDLYKLSTKPTTQW